MNYRHAFHAGNHCDVLKHAALALVLEALKKKAKPFAVLDTHAGRGRYDFDSDEAGRSGEHLVGIARVHDDAAAPAPLAPYLAAVREENPFGGLRWYPGSPLIALAAMRETDRLILGELHPEERAALETALAGDKRAEIDPRDGYEALRARLPFAERRGLVLIDPPFEAKGEYERLARALKDGVKRFATGVFMIWHPLKDAEGAASFMKAAEAMAISKTLTAELNVAAPALGRLSGSGLFLINPPYGLAEQLLDILPYLASKLAQEAGGGWRLVAMENGAVVASGEERLGQLPPS